VREEELTLTERLAREVGTARYEPPRNIPSRSRGR